MATLVPAIKSKLGNTTYYEASMKVRDLVNSVRPPKEMDDWANFGIEEKMQREADLKRVKNQLAPYIAKNADRFFGSIIVLAIGTELEFESLGQFAKGIPNAYKAVAEKMGFLTIDGGTLIVLDGQHRLLALRMVTQGDTDGDYVSEVPDDEVVVIFIKHEENKKTRRIFNTVNRYAKATSRGDNIITSEDDGYAIVARRLLRDGNPLEARSDGKGKKEDVVEWKNNTLSVRTTRLTTIGVVYETVKLILGAQGKKLDMQSRPADEDIDSYTQATCDFWERLLANVEPYKTALADPSKIPSLREDEAKTSLLFKPAAQIALVDGILQAVHMGGLSKAEAMKRVNSIPDWSMKADLWKDVIIKAGGAIDAGADARRKMAALICYLITADKLEDKVKLGIWRMYTEARGNPEANLPKPVVGPQFKADDAAKAAAAIKAAA